MYDYVQVRKSSLVEYVEEDFIVFGGGITERNFSQEAPRSHWGLDRLDQELLPLDDYFKQPCELTGKGVDVYVMDSGIRYTHEQFEGRAKYPGCDPYDDIENREKEKNRGRDCNGHGTQVAGIVGGKTVGVAPDVNLYSVRVLGCELMGMMTSIVAGIECIVIHHNRTGRPAVINISVFGMKSQTVQSAVKKALEMGIHFVTIAGNGRSYQPKSACSVSPANVKHVLTVGATTISDHVFRQSYIGPCVDLFAPGEAITSPSYLRDYHMESPSGTSFAAPFVAGAVALILQRCPNMTNKAMHRILRRELTTSNKVNFTTFLNPPETSVDTAVNATSGNRTQNLVDNTQNKLLYLGDMCKSKGRPRFKLRIRRHCSP